MINEMWLITVLLSVVAALLAVLVLVLGWMGNKLYNRLGDITITIHDLEITLHRRVNNLDRRVTVFETRFPHNAQAVPP